MNPKRLALSFLAVVLLAAPSLAWAQSAILQGGGWTYGHLPIYTAPGTSQPIVQDSGPSRGANSGQGISEINMQAIGTGTPPYANQGTGPYGTTFCMYDAPINNANGYHFLCFSPNTSNGSQSGALITTGAGGIASTQALNFNVNGTAINPVNCSGSPTSSFSVVNGIVTHC